MLPPTSGTPWSTFLSKRMYIPCKASDLQKCLEKPSEPDSGTLLFWNAFSFYKYSISKQTHNISITPYSMVHTFKIFNWPKNSTYLKAIEMRYNEHVLSLLMLIILCVNTLVAPYIRRLRRLICATYYPQREMARIHWLRMQVRNRHFGFTTYKFKYRSRLLTRMQCVIPAKQMSAVFLLFRVNQH